MRTTRILLLSLVVMGLLLAASAVCAHEFIIKPVQLQVPVGHKLPFSIVSAHVFMISEEIEPIAQVEVNLLQSDHKTDVTVKENDQLLTLDGCVELKGQGTAILAGHRKGVIWTNTTEGWKQAGKSGLNGVISSGKYEKFCKTLVQVGDADSGYDRTVGHKLEIVPVSNPSEAVIGRDLTFKILYDGKPLATEVYATYDGFTDNSNTYAYFTEASDEGLAKVKITHPGTWMVRVQKTLEEPTKDYDKHVMRAVLVFAVN